MFYFSNRNIVNREKKDIIVSYLTQSSDGLGRNLRIRLADAVQPVEDASVFPIALATVKSATRNFSTRNVIGEGTFGIVYEVCCLIYPAILNKPLQAMNP